MGIRRQYDAIGPSALTIAVMSFLKNWLTVHLCGSDMRYCGYRERFTEKWNPVFRHQARPLKNLDRFTVSNKTRNGLVAKGAK